MFNRAYSAPRGYDLRAPYNVPMGEIKLMRVVDAFSTASYQQDTITTALPYSCLGPSYSVARLINCKKRTDRMMRRLVKCPNPTHLLMSANQSCEHVEFNPQMSRHAQNDSRIMATAAPSAIPPPPQFQENGDE